MSRINLGRVVLGGLLAGLVVNLGEFLLHEQVIKEREAAAMAGLGKTGPMGALWVWIVFGFAFGIALVWLYAAIRPRFGPGAKTAAIAGVTAWFFGGLMGAVAMANMGLFPNDVLMISTIWGLVETILAAILGAWVYQE
jgi:hypothetical protein